MGNRFSSASASAQSSQKLQKEDGRYQNRLAFLITDCNKHLSVSDRNPLHAGDAYISCEIKVALVASSAIPCAPVFTLLVNPSSSLYEDASAALQ